jgi:hypothetical protein
MIARSRGAVRLDAIASSRLSFSARHFEVVMALKIEPELRAVAEIKAEPKRGVSGDAPPVVDDLGDAVWRNADGLGEPMLRQAVARPGTLLSAFLRESPRQIRRPPCLSVSCHCQ